MALSVNTGALFKPELRPDENLIEPMVLLMRRDNHNKNLTDATMASVQPTSQANEHWTRTSSTQQTFGYVDVPVHHPLDHCQQAAFQPTNPQHPPAAIPKFQHQQQVITPVDNILRRDMEAELIPDENLIDTTSWWSYWWSYRCTGNIRRELTPVENPIDAKTRWIC
jgi:hypothetical protein